MGSVPYRRHLHFDRATPADPSTPVGHPAPADEHPRGNVLIGSPAAASPPTVPGPVGAETAVGSAGAETGSRPARSERPAFVESADPAEPAGAEPAPSAPAEVRASTRPQPIAAGVDEPAGFGPHAADSVDPHGLAESELVAADTRDLASAEPTGVGSAGDIEVVDLDGAGPSEPAGAAAVSARPDRWYDRSARLLGVRRALLDPGRRGLRALVVLAVVAVVAAGVVAWRLRPVTDPVEPPRAPAAAPTAPPSASAGSELVISVVGKVRHPGVVRVPAGSRVADAVRAAGGVLPGVDLGLLNQARRLVDGEQIAVGVTPPPDAGGAGVPGGSANPASKVNLNTATADQLDTLPGVGPTLAGRIISFRTEHGGFRSVEQLKQVSGIGDARYADLKDLVTV